ncbi:YcgN family cysteine cluster protein [Flaviflagellibacter deserti]|uniref:UPF0260 protein ACFPFW_07080 n=1 Tax=Flaviflagellibacter deserti TaxID=2267266 RepID=A0ABV9YY42_9HYPH
MADRFWETKTLAEMTVGEWESLCDGCGRCCLVKLEDEDSGEIAYTDVGCRLLDADKCRCTNYPGRQMAVPECVALSPTNLAGLNWMPPTCAYRLLASGKPLPDWHPLVTGDPDSTHKAGASVRGRVSANEDDITIEETIERIVRWPQKWPKRKRAV